MSIKTIPRPQLDTATVLTPLQLNALHFDRQHTVLTPDLLEQHRPS